MRPSPRASPAVVEALHKSTLETMAQTQLSAAEVIGNIRRQANFNIKRAYVSMKDGERMLSITEMPDEIAACIKSITAVRQSLPNGDGYVDQVVKVEWYSSQEANKILMRHLGLLVEQVEHQVTFQALTKLSDEEFDRRDRESRAEFEKAMAARRAAGLLSKAKK